MPISLTPSFCAAAASGPTGKSTTPNKWSMPCCFKLRAIKVAPSTSLIVFSCQIGGSATSPVGRKLDRRSDYAFIRRGEKPSSFAFSAPPLFDHLVGRGEKRWGERDA